MEEIFDLISVDVKIKLNHIEDSLLAVLITVAIFSVLIYGLILAAQIKYSKMKTEFVEVLTRLTYQEVEEIIAMGNSLKYQISSEDQKAKLTKMGQRMEFF